LMGRNGKKKSCLKQKIKHRRVANRKRRRAILICTSGFFLVVAVFIAVHKFLLSSFFDFDTLDVVGCTRVQISEIRNLFESQFKKTSILNINLQYFKEKIEENQWVKSVKLRRSLPGGVRVLIQEHQVFALLSLEKLFYLNPQGEVITEVQLPDHLDYPVISGLIGVDSQKRFEFIHRAYEVVEKLAGIISRKDISEIHISQQNRLSLLMGQPSIRIQFGKYPWQSRFKRLKTVLEDIRRRQIKVRSIDLDYNKKVVVKLRK